MKWEKVKLKDCCLSIADGDHQAPPKADTGIPFVTISNIVENCFDFSNTMFVPESYYKALDDKRRVQEGDILYSVVGSFGIPVLIKDNTKFVFQRHIAILRPNANKIDSRFLYYSMLSRDFYAKADSVAVGAAQRTISLNALRNLEINIPALSFQRRISSILSAYDDLIENNKKQIKLLEEAAQRLYKEWFVDLRFPGHENVPVVDGVPEGWERKRIKEVVATTSGGTPSRGHAEYYRDGSFFWIKTKELDDGFIFETEELISEEAVNKSSAKILKTGSIILAMYGATIGKLGITTTEMTCNQACCVFDMSTFKNGTEFLFCWLLEHRNFLIHQGKGAAQPNLSQEMIKNFEIILPDIQILEKFSSITSELFALKSSFQKKILLLKSKRDAILPKLTSGEIEV